MPFSQRAKNLFFTCKVFITVGHGCIEKKLDNLKGRRYYVIVLSHAIQAVAGIVIK